MDEFLMPAWSALTLALCTPYFDWLSAAKTKFSGGAITHDAFCSLIGFVLALLH
jgi:hypothetical protein